MTVCDLNVPTNSDFTALSAVLSELAKSGYQKVALNHTCSRLDKAETAEFFAIVEKARNVFEKKEETGGKIKSKDESLQIYTRLTLTLNGSKDDAGSIFSSNNALLHSYDIFSVAPNDIKTFQAACALDVDIILLSPEIYSSYIRKAIVRTAMDRGVHFEISLAPYLKNSQLRTNLFASGSALVTGTGGKNILLTTGATRALEIRASHDLANLATIFFANIDYGVAHGALTHAPASILLRSAARRSAKGVLRVTDADGVQSSKKRAAEPVKGALPDFIPFSDDAPTKTEGAPVPRKKRKGKGKSE